VSYLRIEERELDAGGLNKPNKPYEMNPPISLTLRPFMALPCSLRPCFGMVR